MKNPNYRLDAQQRGFDEALRVALPYHRKISIPAFVAEFVTRAEPETETAFLMGAVEGLVKRLMDIKTASMDVKTDFNA